PRRRPVVGPVAAVVEEEAVVADPQRERDDHEPLQADERRERGAAIDARDRVGEAARARCDRREAGDHVGNSSTALPDGRRRSVSAVPLDRSLEALAQRGARAEAEQLLGARRVETPPRLAVRLRRVPDDLAVEADELRDELRGLAD